MAWSTRKQRGYVRIHDLVVNDPGVGQYQIWIDDESRPESDPVPGGVFNMPEGSAPFILQFEPGLRVFQLSRFEVSVEPPGGRVVSDHRRTILIAERPAGEDAPSGAIEPCRPAPWSP